MGRSKLRYNVQAMAISATTLELKEGAPSRSTNTVELANDAHGEHRASPEGGDGADCGKELGKLYPDRIGGEVVVRGAVDSRGCLLFSLFVS